MKHDKDAQVIIIGGGPAGLSAAALLATHGISVICLDRDDKQIHLGREYDGRTTAISFGSRNLLNHCGIWQGQNKTTSLEDQACPIRDIRILDGTSPILMQFLSQEMQDKSFGWIVENKDLRQALYHRLETLPQAQHITGCAVEDIEIDERNDAKGGVRIALADGREFRGDLLIGADGRGSFTRQVLGIETRQWMYRQKAHICVIHHQHPHDNVAYEHFREEGPFAILPMRSLDPASQGNEPYLHRSAIVWSDHRGEPIQRPYTTPEENRAVMSDEVFLAAMRRRVPDHYGEIAFGQDGSRRAVYPLGLLHAHSYIGPRSALVAEAVHAMHPIAGQGLNMSLRDVGEIAELIINAAQKGNDIAAPDLLETYQKRRRLDNTMMLAATDGLTRLYSSHSPTLRAARKMGVRAISALRPAKKFFMSQAMGLGGGSSLSKFIRN